MPIVSLFTTRDVVFMVYFSVVPRIVLFWTQQQHAFNHAIVNAYQRDLRSLVAGNKQNAWL